MSKVQKYIEENMKTGDPFFTVTEQDASEVGSVVNIKLSNQNPVNIAIFKIVMKDGSVIKAAMRISDLTRKIGTVCAGLEQLGHKDKVHRYLQFAMHGNTIGIIGDHELPPKPNGTALPAVQDECELADRKEYEKWAAEKETTA
jgi:hypothetical protein